MPLAGESDPLSCSKPLRDPLQRVTPNVKLVSDRNVCPGRSSVLGNWEWLGESGKCCVSRQNPACFRYA